MSWSFKDESKGASYNPIMEKGDAYTRKSMNPEGSGSGQNTHGYGFGNKKMMESNTSVTRYPREHSTCIKELFCTTDSSSYTETNQPSQLVDHDV